MRRCYLSTGSRTTSRCRRRSIHRGPPRRYRSIRRPHQSGGSSTPSPPPSHRRSRSSPPVASGRLPERPSGDPLAAESQAAWATGPDLPADMDQGDPSGELVRRHRHQARKAHHRGPRPADPRVQELGQRAGPALPAPAPVLASAVHGPALLVMAQPQVRHRSRSRPAPPRSAPPLPVESLVSSSVAPWTSIDVRPLRLVTRRAPRIQRPTDHARRIRETHDLAAASLAMCRHSVSSRCPVASRCAVTAAVSHWPSVWPPSTAAAFTRRHSCGSIPRTAVILSHMVNTVGT